MRANLFMFSDENETSFIKTFGNRNGVIKEKTICSVVNIAMYPALIQSIAIIPISQQNQQIGNQAKKIISNRLNFAGHDMRSSSAMSFINKDFNLLNCDTIT